MTQKGDVMSTTYVQGIIPGIVHPVIIKRLAHESDSGTKCQYKYDENKTSRYSSSAEAFKPPLSYENDQIRNK